MKRQGETWRSVFIAEWMKPVWKHHILYDSQPSGILEEAEQASQRRSVVTGASQVAFVVESLPASAGVVGSIPGQEGALEEGMATH